MMEVITAFECGIEVGERKKLVRCKDCKHRPKRESEKSRGFALEFPDYTCPCQCDDGYYSWYPPDDWFCADGEPKEGDTK